MNEGLINALSKAGAAVILSAGFVGLGYIYLKHQFKVEDQRHVIDQQMMANMNRQTQAYEDIAKFLEKLVIIYSGGTLIRIVTGKPL